MLAVKAGDVCAVQPFPKRFLANLQKWRLQSSLASLCLSLLEDSLQSRLCRRRRDRKFATSCWMTSSLAPSLFALRRARLALFFSWVISLSALSCCLMLVFWGRGGALIPKQSEDVVYASTQAVVLLLSRAGLKN